MKKALVIGSGAMYGAYGAGALSKLGRQLGPEYFEAIYASSVGVFAGTYLAAGQSQICEEIWRRHVDGRKLINFFRVWNSLKLSYLEKIFRDEHSFLDLDAVFNKSRTQLIYVLTRLSDGAAVYRSPTPKDIFRCMRASAATPFMHPAVHFDNEWYFDGAFSDPLPVVKALEDGAQFVVAISNKWVDFQMPRSFSALGVACRFKSRVISRLVHSYENIVRKTEEALKDPRVLVIRPSKPLPLKSSVDTNTTRLEDTISLGIVDAGEALKLLLSQYNH